MKDWERFEQLTQQIQRELTPDAKVTRNEQLLGRSGVRHQCDIIVRANIGQFDYLCIFECKDTATKVDLEIIRSFADRLDDVGASQGVVIAARGFTSAARRYAHVKDILAYTLIDAASAKWNRNVQLPVVVAFEMLGEARLAFLDNNSGHQLYCSADPSSIERIPLLDTTSSRRITMQEYAERQWDAAREAGSPLAGLDTSGRYEVITSDEPLRVHIRYSLDVSYRICYGRVPLRLGRGFVDSTSSVFITGAAYESEVIDFALIRGTWPHVERFEDVPQKPGARIDLICFYHNGGDPQPEKVKFSYRPR